MEDLNKLKAELEAANIDWPKIKQILQGVSQTIATIAAMIPVPLVKTILMGVVAGLNLVISLLPDSASAS